MECKTNINDDKPLIYINSIEKIKTESDQLDVGLFVAAAGFGTSGNFVNSNILDELNMVDVNCRSVVEQTYYFSNLMASKKRGGIVLFSSLVAFQGTPYSATYSATKSFIQNFAEGLHVELKPLGVSVLAAAPGPVNSGFAQRAKMQMGFSSKPESIAKGILGALGKKVTVRPDFLSKFLGWSLLLLNRWLRVLAMKQIMGGMAIKNRKDLNGSK
jgi:short-subunit dehydrogenase